MALNSEPVQIAMIVVAVLGLFLFWRWRAEKRSDRRDE